MRSPVVCRCRWQRPQRPAEGSRPLPTMQRIRGGNGKVEGRACPAPTDCRKRFVDERGKGGRQPSPFPVDGLPRYKAAVIGIGGSGALGGAQRAPPASKAGPLVRLFAPQGQTLLAPQFRSAQLWPRARNLATPDSKVEEGPQALSANSNTAFA